MPQSHILTDLLEFYIIELPKFNMDRPNKGSTPELDTWIKFIKNPEVITMEDEKKDKALKDAKKVLTKISNDEHERYLAELREKYILDQQAYVETGYKKGHKAGVEEGHKAGIEEGHKAGVEEGIQQIIQSMLEQKLSFEEISKLTKIDIEKIKNIAKK